MSSWFIPTDESSVRANLTKDAVGQGLLAVMSLKLNYWAGNHHVGQGTFDGFAQKVWTFLSKAPAPLDQNSAIYSPAWAIGHMASTKGVLAWIGQHPSVTWILDVSSQGPDGNVHSRWTPTHDVILRANQPPAGTRAIVNVVEGAKQQAMTPYAFLVPMTAITSLAASRETLGQIAAMAPYYHVGANYLTNGAPKPNGFIPLVASDEESIQWVLNYLHIVRKSSTLVKSKALPDREQGHISETRIRALRTALAKTNPPQKIARAILGDADGSMFTTAWRDVFGVGMGANTVTQILQQPPRREGKRIWEREGEGTDVCLLRTDVRARRRRR